MTRDVQQYRRAERRLWESVGLSPREQTLQLSRLGSTVRVQEVGNGEPVLLLHGGPNSGATWAPLLGHADLSRFQWLVLDRPGTGLSQPLERGKSLTDLTRSLVTDVLDALGLASAHVVASSMGGYIALRGALSDPSRFRRMVQVACPALLPGQRAPSFMRLLMKPGVRRLVAALPPNERAQESILRQIGHGASLDAGRLPPEHQRWYAALHRHTDTMRHDFDLIHSVRGPGGGFDPAASLTDADLAAVGVPTHFVWGSEDTFGDESTARRVAGIMPRATLQIVPGAGHLPWLDRPEAVAAACTAFLAGHREGHRSA